MNRCFLLRCRLLLVGLLPFGLFAQTPDYRATNQVIGTTGHMLSRQGLTWAYTVGEAVIQTFPNSGLKMVFTQGFHQPEISRSVRVHDTGSWPAAWNAKVFPNPAVDAFQLSVATPGLHMWVTDAAGRTQLAPQPLTAPEVHAVTCATWEPGVYFLYLQKPNTAQRGVLRLVVLPR